MLCQKKGDGRDVRGLVELGTQEAVQRSIPGAKLQAEAQRVHPIAQQAVPKSGSGFSKTQWSLLGSLR